MEDQTGWIEFYGCSKHRDICPNHPEIIGESMIMLCIYFLVDCEYRIERKSNELKCLVF